MKKKNLVVKGMAMFMACATVAGNTGIVAHAYVADDGTVHSDREAGGNSGGDSIDIGGGSSGSNSGGSGSSGDSGNYSYDGGSGNSGSGDSGASYSAPAPKAAGSTTGVTGKEQFRALANSGSGIYKVTHKGIEIATFTLMGTDKKAVPCTKVTLKQREDSKWAINYEVADATGLTVGAPLDRTYLYSTLGVSYVTINDEIVIDIEAEAAAKTTK